jgi:hypothetical protein
MFTRSLFLVNEASKSGHPRGHNGYDEPTITRGIFAVVHPISSHSSSVILSPYMNLVPSEADNQSNQYNWSARFPYGEYVD